MKQFLVLLAVFPIMLAFMLQFTVQQNMDYRIQRINQAVENSCEQAKAEGFFSQDNLRKLRCTVSDVTSCAEENIRIETSEEVKYRTGGYDTREMISFYMSVPLEGIAAMPALFGISREENQMLYVLENEFPSERLL